MQQAIVRKSVGVGIGQSPVVLITELLVLASALPPAQLEALGAPWRAIDA
jgi:hypothetical protein